MNNCNLGGITHRWVILDMNGGCDGAEQLGGEEVIHKIHKMNWCSKFHINHLMPYSGKAAQQFT